MIRSTTTEQNNGYVTAILIEPDSLPEGNGLQTTYNDGGVIKLVAKLATDLPTGNGLQNSAIVNGYNTLAIVFRTDAEHGSTLESQSNGYNAVVVENIASLQAEGSGLDHTVTIDGETAFVITGITSVPFADDVVQWLKGDTFEDEGTTYMRDYSGNDYHAVVVDADTIVQQTTSTDLYTADLQQGGYWFTDASTPNNIDISDLNYEVYDATPYYGVTFSDISESSFKNIITYATPKDNFEKADVLNFVNGNDLLLDSDGLIITDNDNNNLYARKV